MFMLEILSISAILTYIIIYTSQETVWRRCSKKIKNIFSLMTAISVLYIGYGIAFVKPEMQHSYVLSEVSAGVNGSKVVKEFVCQKRTWMERENYLFVSIFAGDMADKTKSVAPIEKCTNQFK